MGKQLTIKGPNTELDAEFEEDTTVRQLKQRAGIPAKKPVIFDDGQDTYDLTDTDTVAGIREGATIVSIPNSGPLFG